MAAVKQVDIAQVLGLTQARVTQLKAKGMPVDSIDCAAAWYRENVDQKLSPKLTPSIAPPPAVESKVAIDAEMYDLAAARAKRETHEANLAELKERQALGELVEADKIKRSAVTLAAMTRSAFEKIPDKLADRLAAEAEPTACHALLTAEIDQVLADLAASCRNFAAEAADGRG